MAELKASIASEGVISGKVSAGEMILNDYRLIIEDIEGGHRLTATRGSEVQSIDIMDGVNGFTPTISIASGVQPDGSGGAIVSHKIIITDVNGTKEIMLRDGKDGADGTSSRVTVSQAPDGALIQSSVIKPDGSITSTMAVVKDGKTPEKGVDYFTEAEVQEIIDKASAGGGTGPEGGAVTSVNGQVGAVTIDYKDTGALDAFAKPIKESGRVVVCSPTKNIALNINAPDASEITVSNKNLNIDDIKLGIRGTAAGGGRFWDAGAGPYPYMSHVTVIPVVSGQKYFVSFSGSGDIHSVLYYKDGVYTDKFRNYPGSYIEIPDGVNGIALNIISISGNLTAPSAYNLQVELNDHATDYVKGVRTVYSADEFIDGVMPFAGVNVIWPDSGEISVNGYIDLQYQMDELTKFKDYELQFPTILYLTGDTSDMSKDNAVQLDWRYGARGGKCNVKWQGSSSLQYPKKNYTINFDTAIDIGFGAQTKYCMKADFIDPSHARNVVSARLWGSIVSSRTNPPSKLLSAPNNGAINGIPVIINLNGEFHGVYNWNIPKEPWLFNMVKGSASPQAFVCAEGTEAARFRTPITEFGATFDLEYNYNDDEEWVKDSLNTLINACINSDGTDLDTTIAQYLDWDSAIDYYIFANMVTGIDIIERNYILVTYDGVKWYFSAYDLDMTFGLGFENKFLFNKTEPTFTSSANMHRVFELIKNYKFDKLKERYARLRESVMNEENVCKVFRDYCAYFPLSVLNEDLRKWPTIKGTFVNNADQICDYYRERVKFTDEQMGISSIPTASAEVKGGVKISDWFVMDNDTLLINQDKLIAAVIGALPV